MGSTVIVTDAKYRAALALMRSLSAAGHRVILTQTARESSPVIPAFASNCAAETRYFDCSVEDEAYLDALLALAKHLERPVLFPVGAKTLEAVGKNLARFSEVCDLAAAPSEVLDCLNDKPTVAARAKELGIPVPRSYENGQIPESFPVVVKPACGEKFGLTAAARYVIASNAEEYRRAYEKMSVYGAPIVQERLVGEAVGVSLLMDGEKAVSAICHRRIREYPASGGPSACCESFYDETLVRQSEKLLASFGLRGIAMVEYKAGRLLEVNPRIWGSFPLTYAARTTFADDYVRLSRGEVIDHPLNNYETGVRMHFALSDLAAVADYARHGRFSEAFDGIADFFRRRTVEGMHDLEGQDKRPYRVYLKKKFLKR